MKWSPLVGWVLWLLLAVCGSIWLAVQDERSWQRPPQEWKATRELAKNHQIAEADLEGPTKQHLLARMPKKESLIGQYLLRARKRGESVSRSDVASQPSLEPCESGSGVWLYALKDHEYLADGVQVGSWVVICSVREAKEKTPQAHCSKSSLAVEAVHRPTKAGDATWVALRVPSCRLADVGQYISRESRFLLVAANPPPLTQQACQAAPPSAARDQGGLPAHP